MNDLEKAIEKSRAETCENRRKSIHNHFCEDVEDLQPYDNTQFLNMVGQMRSLIEKLKSTNE